MLCIVSICILLTYVQCTYIYISGESNGGVIPPPPPGINVETLQEIEIIDHDEEDDNDSVSAIVSHPFR